MEITDRYVISKTNNVGPHANILQRYEPPSAKQRLKDEDGNILRAMSEKTAELCRHVLLRYSASSCKVARSKN